MTAKKAFTVWAVIVGGMVAIWFGWVVYSVYFPNPTVELAAPIRILRGLAQANTEVQSMPVDQAAAPAGVIENLNAFGGLIALIVTGLLGLINNKMKADNAEFQSKVVETITLKFDEMKKGFIAKPDHYDDGPISRREHGIVIGEVVRSIDGLRKGLDGMGTTMDRYHTRIHDLEDDSMKHAVKIEGLEIQTGRRTRPESRKREDDGTRT